jgi:hypothetical protein
MDVCHYFFFLLKTALKFKKLARSELGEGKENVRLNFKQNRLDYRTLPEPRSAMIKRITADITVLLCFSYVIWKDYL